MKRVLLSWSSGKDSAWTLHLLRQLADVEVVGLLTTFNEAADRVAMHAIRRELVEAQAASTRLPLWPILLPWPYSNEVYETRMREAIERARREGITHMAFGDLFLEDIRAYRIRQLAGTGIEPLFPLWGTPADTPDLARSMLAAGLRAVLACVNPKQLDGKFVGRWFDAKLLTELPPDVDPCGERGEFHTFCCGGPMFSPPSRCMSARQNIETGSGLPISFLKCSLGEAVGRRALGRAPRPAPRPVRPDDRRYEISPADRGLSMKRERQGEEKDTGPPLAIECISAVSLATHDMARAVRFYRALGFTVRYGGETASFTSLHAGSSYLNLVAQPVERQWCWWGRVIFYVSDVDAFSARILAAGSKPDSAPSDAPWGERFFHLTDPDGHELSFATPLARGEMTATGTA